MIFHAYDRLGGRTVLDYLTRRAECRTVECSTWGERDLVPDAWLTGPGGVAAWIEWRYREALKHDQPVDLDERVQSWAASARRGEMIAIEVAGRAVLVVAHAHD